MDAYYAEDALLPTGWARDVRIEVNATGDIASIAANASAEGTQRLAGPLLPGMPNLHSHAFQRAMAGLAEMRTSPDDDFWSWRELMYKFVARLTPEHVAKIARFAYIEMLKSGYTAVAEFHYLHNDESGSRYADPAEMALAHVGAARDTGIAITMLPVLYSYGNFGSAPLADRQRRFRTSPSEILEVVAAVRASAGGHRDVACGVAPHSVRAVNLEGLQELLSGLSDIDSTSRVHMHAAEQVREVEESVAFCGQRPVEWLLDHFPVDKRWCLVHATHLTDQEIRGLAQSGAVAGLCPTTEANLGDGIFPLPDYREAGGRFGIGSDSQVSRNAFEELRLLEYVQRLVLRRRNVNVGDASAAVGTTLWLDAARGGAQAMGRAMGALAAGQRADFVVLDRARPDIGGRRGDAISNAAVFSGSEGLVRDVMVGGRWKVREGRHPHEADATRAYADVLKVLLA